MRYAVEQARLSPPSPPKFCVGAVLVDADANTILATGYSEELPRDRPGDPGSTHAEHCCFIKVADRQGIHDFDIANVLPPNTVLYTTMEPCNERLSRNRTCVERILGLGDAIKSSTSAFGSRKRSSGRTRESSALRVLGSRWCCWRKTLNSGLSSWMLPLLATRSERRGRKRLESLLVAPSPLTVAGVGLTPQLRTTTLAAF